jgi:PRC-barrel domain
MLPSFLEWGGKLLTRARASAKQVRKGRGMKNVELYGRVRYAVQIEGLSERITRRHRELHHLAHRPWIDPETAADEKKIGKLERVMLDKASGKVAYAVLSFGGFLGMGEDYYPTPWSLLKYDTNLGGYRTNLTKDQLEKAPKYNQSVGTGTATMTAASTIITRRNPTGASSSSQ